MEEKTRGLITELVAPSALSADTRLILLNAVYFKAPWQIPFDKALTYKEQFNVDSNFKSTVDMMIQVKISAIFIT